jgi:hypothetical protein
MKIERLISLVEKLLPEYLDIEVRVSFLADITPAYQLVRLCSSVLSVCTASR